MKRGVDQIDQAARWLRGNNNKTEGVDNQSWDVAVRSVAHYPQVVYMMSEKLDWTTALGQAYVNQSTDVLKSVQRLRARAKAAGYLVTTPASKSEPSPTRLFRRRLVPDSKSTGIRGR